MIQQYTENNVSSENCSEYELACKRQVLDKLLASMSHLFFYVTKGGDIHSMTGLSKNNNLLQQDQGNEKDPVRSNGMPRPENRTGWFSPSPSLQGLSINSVMPWLWGELKTFLNSGTEKADVVKSVNVLGENVEYHVGLGRVFSAEGGTAGAIISVMAKSEIGRVARDRRRLEVLEETFRDIRTFCHDFSQPLMVLSGYLELLNNAQPDDEKCRQDSQLERIEREIHKLGGIYQKLRDAVIHCRKQIDVVDLLPPS